MYYDFFFLLGHFPLRWQASEVGLVLLLSPTAMQVVTLGVGLHRHAGEVVTHSIVANILTHCTKTKKVPGIGREGERGRRRIERAKGRGRREKEGGREKEAGERERERERERNGSEYRSDLCAR